MKILVISDTHRQLNNVEAVLNQIGDEIHMIFHLGDIEADQTQLMENHPNYIYHFVSGNNDLNPQYPDLKIVEVGTTKFLLTHGHLQQVHWNYNSIYYFAKEKQVDVAVFGHTHEPLCDVGGDVVLFNPGSISLPRTTKTPTFGIITLEQNTPPKFDLMELDKNMIKILKSC